MRYLGDGEDEAFSILNNNEVVWRHISGADVVTRLANEQRLRVYGVLRQGNRSVVKYSTRQRTEEALDQITAETRAAMLLAKEGPHPLLVLPITTIINPDVGSFSIAPYAGLSAAEMRQSEWTNLGVHQYENLSRTFAISILMTQKMFFGSADDGKRRFLHKDIKLLNTCYDRKYGIFRLIDYGAFSSLDKEQWTDCFDLRYLDPQMARYFRRKRRFAAEFNDGVKATISGTTDIFLTALAVVHLFLGHLPAKIDLAKYDGNVGAYLKAVWKFRWDKCVELATMPTLMKSWVLKALAFNPKNRFQSAAEALEHPWLKDAVQPVMVSVDEAKPQWEQLVQELKQDLSAIQAPGPVRVAQHPGCFVPSLAAITESIPGSSIADRATCSEAVDRDAHHDEDDKENNVGQDHQQHVEQHDGVNDAKDKDCDSCSNDNSCSSLSKRCIVPGEAHAYCSCPELRRLSPPQAAHAVSLVECAEVITPIDRPQGNATDDHVDQGDNNTVVSNTHTIEQTELSCFVAQPADSSGGSTTAVAADASIGAPSAGHHGSGNLSATGSPVNYSGDDVEEALAILGDNNVVWKHVSSADLVHPLIQDECVKVWAVRRSGRESVVKYSTQERTQQALGQIAAEHNAAMLLAEHGPHPLLVFPVKTVIDPDAGFFSISPYAGVQAAAMRQRVWVGLEVSEYDQLCQTLAVSALLTQEMFYGSTDDGRRRFLHKDIKLENICYNDTSKYFSVVDYGAFSSVDKEHWNNCLDLRYLDCQMACYYSELDQFAAEFDDGVKATISGTTDIFLTGLAVVKLFLGHLPAKIDLANYDGNIRAYFKAVWKFWWDECDELDTMPTLMKSWVLKALAFEPADRFQSATEALEHPWLKDALQPVIDAVWATMPEWQQLVQGLKQDLKAENSSSGDGGIETASSETPVSARLDTGRFIASSAAVPQSYTGSGIADVATCSQGADNDENGEEYEGRVKCGVAQHLQQQVEQLVGGNVIETANRDSTGSHNISRGSYTGHDSNRSSHCITAFVGISSAPAACGGDLSNEASISRSFSNTGSIKSQHSSSSFDSSNCDAGQRSDSNVISAAAEVCRPQDECPVEPEVIHSSIDWLAQKFCEQVEPGLPKQVPSVACARPQDECSVELEVISRSIEWLAQQSCEQVVPGLLQLVPSVSAARRQDECHLEPEVISRSIEWLAQQSCEQVEPDLPQLVPLAAGTALQQHSVIRKGNSCGAEAVQAAASNGCCRTVSAAGSRRKVWRGLKFAAGLAATLLVGCQRSRRRF